MEKVSGTDATSIWESPQLAGEFRDVQHALLALGDAIKLHGGSLRAFGGRQHMEVLTAAGPVRVTWHDFA